MIIGYTVRVTREDNLWVADIGGLPPNLIAATDVEHFANLDVEVRDLIAGLTDADPDEFDLDWRYEINGRDVTDALGRFLAVHRDVENKLVEREAARMDAVHELTDTGLSQRAIADVIGVSHQRVNQLVKG